MAAWLPLLSVVYQLPRALDRQLRTEAGISHIYYAMLSTLSAQPDQTLSMGDLARLTYTSPSRLTHAVGTLEKRGWVRRRPCLTNRRIQYASLTPDGQKLLERIAPGHVAEVRRRVFDALSDEQVTQLREVMFAVLTGISDDPAATRAGDETTDE